MKGKKRYLILTIIFLFTLLVLPSTVFAEETPGSNDSYEWMDNGTSISITNYIGTDTIITIPDELASKPVTQIAGGAFSGKSVESVIIPDTVTSIGPGAFAGSTSLQSVTLPALLSEIKGETFIGCSSLQSIDIPDSVTMIDFTAFRNCTSLSSVTLSDALETIGQNTFAGCTSLQNIELPAGLQGLVGETFKGCSALQSISFPASMTNVGNDSFKDCTSLTSVWVFSESMTFGENGNNVFANTALSSDGIYGFADSSAQDYATTISAPFHALYTVSFDSKGGTAVDDIITATGSAITKPTDPTKTGYTLVDWFTDEYFTTAWDFDSDTVTADTTLYAKWVHSNGTYEWEDIEGGAVAITNYVGLSTAITIPSQLGGKPVTQIAGGAFSGKSVISVVVPNIVTSIGPGAFAGCTSLQSVALPASLSEIKGETFIGCSSLQSIDIPDSVTNISFAAFRNCTSLSSVAFPDTLETIGENTFAGCTSLQNIELPAGLQGLVGETFKGCSALQSISFPASMTSVGNDSFKDCTSLTSVWIYSTDIILGEDGNNIFDSAPLTDGIYGFADSTADDYADMISVPFHALYTVSFDSKGGTAVDDIITATGSAITKPTDPTKTNYAFSGWYKDAGFASAWNFSTDKVTANTTLYAKWTINSYTVTFNSNGGSTVGSVTANYNTTITKPTDPTKTGYTFAGWYKNSALTTAWNFSTDKVTAATTLYAKWTINKYTLSVSSNNTSYGTVTGAGTYDYNSSATLKATPKAGYRFVRWLEGTTTVSTNSTYSFTVTKGRTLKAEFAKIATPSISSASSSGYNSVTLKWGSVTGANSYDIYRATSSGGTYSKIASTTSTSYKNTALTTGKTYYYKVKAVCVAGSTTTYSSSSAYKYAKPIPSTPSTTVKSNSYTSIKVSWGKISGASGYKVYRATSKTGTYSLIKTTTSTSYTNSSLKTGKTYYYKVRAYRTVGSSKVYSSYSAYHSAKPVPSAPSTISAVKVSSTSIKVSWGKVSGVTKYQVYRATSSTGTYSLVKTTTSTSYTNSSLKKGKTYYYKVRAYHLEGSTKVYGPYSKAVSFKLP
jgi:uncharacterized repeat protein (TIGR02543 family)